MRDAAVKVKAPPLRLTSLRCRDDVEEISIIWASVLRAKIHQMFNKRTISFFDASMYVN